MPEIYKKITGLCEERGISGSRMCLDLGLSRSFLTELKMGRAKSVTLETASLIADYFGVEVGSLADDTKSQIQETKYISIEQRAKQILSGLTDSGSVTLMLDGKPATPEAVKAFENAVMVGIELARRVNGQNEQE